MASGVKVVVAASAEPLRENGASLDWMVESSGTCSNSQR